MFGKTVSQLSQLIDKVLTMAETLEKLISSVWFPKLFTDV